MCEKVNLITNGTACNYSITDNSITVRNLGLYCIFLHYKLDWFTDRKLTLIITMLTRCAKLISISLIMNS